MANHRVSHSQRFFPHNRDSKLVAAAEATLAKIKQAAAAVGLVRVDVDQRKTVRPKPRLLTPAELTLEKRKLKPMRPMVIR